jgi:hypothetical protein
MKFYAMRWVFDGLWADSGRRCVRSFWFPSKKERSEWIAEGNPYRGNGFREAIASKDRELRFLIREAKKGNYEITDSKHEN